jgi:guanylate kinase
MVAEHPDLQLSISTTTRPIRPGETDGVHYHFVSEEQFRDAVAQGRFLEWAQVHDNLYGSDGAWVDQTLAQGRDILFDIDVQGGHQIRAARSDACLILIVPPSWAELERRLRGRGTDDDAVIRKRLAAAHAELVDAQDYDVVVVNDQLESALECVRRVLRGEVDDGAARAVLEALVKAS